MSPTHWWKEMCIGHFALILIRKTGSGSRYRRAWDTFFNVQVDVGNLSAILLESTNYQRLEEKVQE